MKCSECGSMNFEDVGYEDGGGDYGDGFTEVYKCCDCGAVNYGDDIEAAFHDDSAAGFDDGIDHEKRSAAFMDKLFGDDNAHLDIGDIPF